MTLTYARKYLQLFQRSNWSPALPLAAITLVGLAIRLVGLGDRSLRENEAYAVDAASRPFLEIVWPVLIDNGNMLFFYIIASFWIDVLPKIPPVSEFLLRLLPLIFSVATIPALYALAHQLLQPLSPKHISLRTAALFAALFFALSPFSILYAQEFRAYSLQLLLLTLSSLVMLRILTESGSTTPRWYLLCSYAILSALAIYSHMLSVLFVSGQMISLLIFLTWKRYSMSAIRIVISGLGILLLIAPLLITFGTRGASQIEWIAPERNSFGQVRTILASLTGASGNLFNDVNTLPLIASLILFVAGAVELFKNRTRFLPLLLVLFTPLVWSVIAAVGLSVFLTPLGVTRYFHFLLLPFAALWALGAYSLTSYISRAVARGSVRRLAAGGLIAALAGAVFVNGVGDALARPPRENWKAVALHIVRVCSNEQTNLIALTSTQSGAERILSIYDIKVDSITNKIDVDALRSDQSLCVITYHVGIKRSARVQLQQQLIEKFGPMTIYREGKVQLLHFQASQPSTKP